MHEVLADRLVKKVRKRISEGDCPRTSALGTETLEQLVDHLATRLERVAAFCDVGAST